MLFPESLTLHWERPKPNARPAHYRWQRQTDAINIEMTAYAMLTFLLKKDVAKAVPIVRWLTSQRGPQGGFISTQVRGGWLGVGVCVVCVCVCVCVCGLIF